MNIQENLQLLQQTKENIYQAIIAVGGELEASAPFSAYPEAILALSGDTPTPTPTPEPTSAVTSSVQDPAFRIVIPDVGSGEYWMIGADTSSAFTYTDSGSSLWFTSSRQQGVWATEDAADGVDGVMHAADYETQIQQGKLSLKTLSAGTWYVKAWVSTDGTWSTASAVTAVTPVVEVVPAPNYTYAISMDGGNTFGTGELDGTYDTTEGGWVKNYIDLYYGSGDWQQSNFVPAGTVAPSNYTIVNNTGGGGITDYASGFDSNEGKWYVAADSSTVQYSEMGEFFEVKAQSGNTDISNATLHVNIDIVDQEADPCDIDPCSDPECPNYDAETCGGEIDYSQYDWAMYLDGFGLDDGGMSVSDGDPHEITIQYGSGDWSDSTFVQDGDVPYGNYTIGLYDVGGVQPSSPSETSSSFNGFDLSQSGDVWTITNTSAIKWDSVGIAVFDLNDGIKILTSLSYNV